MRQIYREADSAKTLNLIGKMGTVFHTSILTLTGYNPFKEKTSHIVGQKKDRWFLVFFSVRSSLAGFHHELSTVDDCFLNLATTI